VSATAKGEPAMDKAVVISKVAKISKVTKLLVNRHGKLCLRDQPPTSSHVGCSCRHTCLS